MQMAMNLESMIYWAPTRKLGRGWIAHKDSPSPPPTPDPKATADAQTASNIATGNANATLNRVNQVTPFGNMTYSHVPGQSTFDQAGFDKATSDWNQKQADGTLGDAAMPDRAAFTKSGPDQYTATTTLAPAQQHLLDTQNTISQNLGDLGKSQLGRVSDSLSHPLSFNGLPSLQQSGLVNHVDYGNIQNDINKSGVQNVLGSIDADRVPSLVGGADLAGAFKTAQDAAYNQSASRLDPQFGQQQHDLQNSLTQQGIMQNSDAWNRAMESFGRTRNDAYQTAHNNSVGLGNAAESQLYGQGLQSNQNTFNQILSRGNFANGAQGQQYSQALGDMNAHNAAQSQGFGQALSNAGLNNSAQAQQFSQSQSARNQGINELFSLRNNPLNELNALRSGSQVTSPTFSNVPTANIGGTDIAGLTQNAYANRMGQYNAAQQSNNSMTSSLFSLAGSALPLFV